MSGWTLTPQVVMLIIVVTCKHLILNWQFPPLKRSIILICRSFSQLKDSFPTMKIDLYAMRFNYTHFNQSSLLCVIYAALFY